MRPENIVMYSICNGKLWLYSGVTQVHERGDMIWLASTPQYGTLMFFCVRFTAIVGCRSCTFLTLMVRGARRHVDLSVMFRRVGRGKSSLCCLKTPPFPTPIPLDRATENGLQIY